MILFIYIKLFLSVASFFFAGYIPVYFLLIRKNIPVFYYRSFSGKVFIFFISFFIGIFLVSNYLIILSIAEVRFTLLNAALFSAVCFTAFLATIFFGKKRASKDRSNIFPEYLPNKNNTDRATGRISFFIGKKYEKHVFAIFLFLIIIIASAVVFFTFLFPIRFWDAISCWSLKGRAFYIDGSIMPFFTEHSYGFSHLSYPLYISLAQTWVYIWLGYLDETLVKVIFPLFYLSLIFIFYYLFSKRTGRMFSIIFVFIIAGLPVIMDHGYIEYTNLLFSIILFLGVYFYYQHLYDPSGSLNLLFLSTLFFTLLSQVRTEGLLFLTVFILFNLAYKLARLPNKNGNDAYSGEKEDRDLKLEQKKAKIRLITEAFSPLLLSIILMVPWLVIKSRLKIPTAGNEWSGLFSGINWQDFKMPDMFDFIGALKALTGEMLFSAYDSVRAFLGSAYGVIWVIMFFLLILNIKRMFKDVNWVFPIFITAGFISIFLSIGLISEFAWSTDRYILHLFPLTYFWIFYNLPLFKNGEKKSLCRH